jgi:hypothetical protein
MNTKFNEEYAPYVFKGFEGSYMDYFIFCLEKLIDDKNITIKSFDSLIGLSLYNMFFY